MVALGPRGHCLRAGVEVHLQKERHGERGATQGTEAVPPGMMITWQVYWRRDVEDRAVKRWGSLEKVMLEREVGEGHCASRHHHLHFDILK